MGHLETFKNVMLEEAMAVRAAHDRITQQQVKRMLDIFQDLRNSGSKLIFTGVGKSGLVGKKLASTFCSLGLQSVFLHPVEALHGDLGLVDNLDGIVLISKSGNTEELIKLVPYLGIAKNRSIGLLGNIDSPIAEKCEVVFDCSVDKEACVHGQAPTSSTTVALAVGDAMAVCFSRFIGLSKEGFAINHPGGMLGKSLRLKVSDIMRPFAECPCLGLSSSLQDVVLVMTQKPVGACAILDENQRLAGLLVEGDFRRTLLEKGNEGLHTPVQNIMNPDPVVIRADQLAYDALKHMQKRKNPIDILPVLEEKSNLFLGFLRIHDLWKEGFR